MVVSTIGACLQKNPEFQVEQPEGDLSEIVGKANPPDVILLDFETVKSYFALSLMCEYPAIIYLCVYLAKN